MAHDDADLLGRREMPIAPRQTSWLDTTTKAVFYLGFFILFCFIARDVRQYVLKWQEQRYRLQKRRKHGIPDEDRRPFNVAYAAAIQARKERELEARAAFQEDQRRAREQAEASKGKDRLPIPGLRQRVLQNQQDVRASPFQTRAAPDGSLPQQRGATPIAQEKTLSLDSSTFSDRHNIHVFGEPSRSTTQVRFTDFPAYHAQSVPRNGSVDPDMSLDHDATSSDGKKHALDDEGDLLPEASKKSRREGEDLIDGDNEVDWEPQGKAANGTTKRGSKRHASVEDDDATEIPSKKSRGKRARRSSRGKKSVDAERGDGDENADKVMDLDSIARGKKRDRAEAGSTFGGDEDSPIGDGKKSRRRRRRVVPEDAPDAKSRSKKRSHDAEHTPDGDEEPSTERAKRKKGRRVAVQDDDASTESSFNDATPLKDPFCKGRKIGEEWDVNGIHWKLGTDGRRLRQTLLRKRRTRYSMPEDSQHPDSQAQMVVVVESWLNDEEYKAAEDRGDLFTPNEVEIPESPSVGDVPDSPSQSGKTLLWSTPRKASYISRKPFKDSIATNIGLRNANPFDQPHGSFGKRVTSGHVGVSSVDADAHRLRHSKSYSKWEKQDLEADAMAQLRKRLEEQKKVATPTKTEAPPLMAQTASTSLNFSSSTAPPAASVPSPMGPPPFIVPTANATASNHTATNTGTDTAPFSFPPPRQSSAASSTSSTAKQGTETKPPGSSADPPNPFTSFAKTPSFNTQSGGPANASQPNSSTGAAAGPPAVPNFFNLANQGKDAAAAATTRPATSTIPAFSMPSATTPAAPATSTTPSFFPNTAPAQTSNTQPGTTTSAFTLGSNTGASSTPLFGKLPATQTGSGNTQSGQASSQSQAPAFSGSPFMSKAPSFNPPDSSTAPTSTSDSVFSFGTPQPTSQLNAKPAPPSSSADINKPVATQPSGAAVPKFNFGFAPKPAANAPPSNSSASEEASKAVTSSTPVFKFNAPSVPSASQAPTSAPKFAFGLPAQPNQSSSFAPTATPSVAAPGNAASSDAASAQPKLAFNFGGTNGTANPTGSQFGGASAGSTTALAFGGTGAGGPSGSAFAKPALNPTPFGATPKPTDAPKPLFGFGTSSAPSPFGASSGSTPAGNAETKQDKPAFSFNFGASGGGATQASGNAFGTGTQNTQNPFAFKAPAPGSTFSFGSASNATSNTGTQ